MAAGPVERALREALAREGGIDGDGLRRLGPLGRVFFDRLLKAGAIEPTENGRHRLRIHAIDPAIAEERARAKRDAEAQWAARQAERQAHAQREQERLRQERDNRALWAGMERYTDPRERQIVIQERTAALQSGRAAVEEALRGG